MKPHVFEFGAVVGWSIWVWSLGLVNCTFGHPEA